MFRRFSKATFTQHKSGNIPLNRYILDHRYKFKINALSV